MLTITAIQVEDCVFLLTPLSSLFPFLSPLFHLPLPLSLTHSLNRALSQTTTYPSTQSFSCPLTSHSFIHSPTHSFIHCIQLSKTVQHPFKRFPKPLSCFVIMNTPHHFVLLLNHFLSSMVDLAIGAYSSDQAFLLRLEIHYKLILDQILSLNKF